MTDSALLAEYANGTRRSFRGTYLSCFQGFPTLMSRMHSSVHGKCGAISADSCRDIPAIQMPQWSFPTKAESTAHLERWHGQRCRAGLLQGSPKNTTIARLGLLPVTRRRQRSILSAWLATRLGTPSASRISAVGTSCSRPTISGSDCRRSATGLKPLPDTA